MKQFEYTIKEPVGIHARPAGMLVKEAAKYSSQIIIDKNGNKVDVKRLMALMALGVKCGETVTFTIDGEDEESAAIQLETFCKENL